MIGFAFPSALYGKIQRNMIITLCLLILIYSILKRPVGWLVKKLEGIDWKRISQDAWYRIVTYSKKAGRAATREVLKFYYVMEDGDLSTFEKALVYAGIVYIVVPGDLMPRAVLGWLGLLDDVGVAAWILKKISDRVSADITRKVEATLDDWFGPETVTTLTVDSPAN